MISTTEISNPLDLTNCDKEKIHHISYTQGHGAFIAISAVDSKIRHLSKNVAEFFGKIGDPEVFLNRKITDLVSMDVFQGIQVRMRSPQLMVSKGLHFSYRGGELSLEVFIYKIDESLIGLEFEPLIELSHPLYNAEERLNDYILTMQDAKNLNELSNIACRAVRSFSDFDRVMLYKFFPPDMYGEVLGEDKTAHAQTFMGHRFPSTDIPKPARDLYLRNHVRYIHDSHSENSEISPKLNSNGTALDLSDSRLRGVSLIHLEYLKNMGVRGSMSIAIISEGKLWGLIACHSSQPKMVSQTTRALCKTIANSLALSLPILEKNVNQSREVKFHRHFYETFSHLKLAADPMNELFKRGEDVRGLFDCTGYALVSSAKVDVNGLSPLSKDLKKIWQWLLQKMDAENLQIFMTESLSSYDEDFHDIRELVCGIMAIRLSEIDDSLFIFMRPEFIQTIQWGGDPRKNIASRNYKGDINPRVSFETWTETLKDHSAPWMGYEKLGAKYFRDLIFDTLVRKEVLINELSEKINGKKSR